MTAQRVSVPHWCFDAAQSCFAEPFVTKFISPAARESICYAANCELFIEHGWSCKFIFALLEILFELPPGAGRADYISACKQYGRLIICRWFMGKETAGELCFDLKVILSLWVYWQWDFCLCECVCPCDRETESDRERLMRQVPALVTLYHITIPSSLSVSFLCHIQHFANNTW